MHLSRTLLLCALLLFCSAANAAPHVVVSIKPLHSLAAGVMAGVAEPVLLLRGGESPHSYAMRPSDARQLQQADLVVWIGGDLESFLIKPLATLSSARQLTVMDLPGLTLWTPRSGDNWSDGEERHHHAEDGHGHDLHLWLDPANAAAIVDALAGRLSALDPANRQRYQDNAQALHQRIKKLDQKLSGMLAPLADQPYVVFHDAYQYFERRYGLNVIGALSMNPDLPPGARRVSQLRGKVQRLGARCVFSEPQFKPTLTLTLTRGTQVRTGELDPIGARLRAGPDAYFELLEQMGASIRDCLG